MLKHGVTHQQKAVSSLMSTFAIFLEHVNRSQNNNRKIRIWSHNISTVSVNWK